MLLWGSSLKESGKKHGQWFDHDRHFKIHDDVIREFGCRIGLDNLEYQVTGEKEQSYITYEFKIIFPTSHGSIKITKRAITNNILPPTKIKTTHFSYNYLAHDLTLQYHSSHGSEYESNSPWHNKPHRHKYERDTRIIQVYSDDHRPNLDKRKKYPWSESGRKGETQLEFLGHKNWPHVSEFLEEISNIENGRILGLGQNLIPPI